jgi:hypothetical protein
LKTDPNKKLSKKDQKRLDQAKKLREEKQGQD